MSNLFSKKLSICFFSGLFSIILLSCSLKTDVPMNSSGDAKSTYKPLTLEEDVRNYYKAFWDKENMYALTATKAYPRGDSRAKYAFGDCTGDNMPELHLSFGASYNIYTYREGEVTLLVDLGFWYPLVTPGRDGVILYSGRLDRGSDMISAGSRIPLVDNPSAGMEQVNERIDYYGSLKLDAEGQTIKSESRYFSRTQKESQGSYTYTYKTDENEASKEEWAFYKRILSGDFSFLSMDERSRISFYYHDSLDPLTGRSQWKYILQDFTGDGIKDLFIEHDPDSKNFTSTDFSYDNMSRGMSFFSYADGGIDWWISDGATGVRYIPLRNGQVIVRESYGVTSSMWLGRMSREHRSRHETEQEYTILYVNFDVNSHYNKEWYEEWYGPDREFRNGENFYYVQEYRNDRPYGDSRELSKEEWAAFEEMLGELLIPDSQWKPASVFPPNRYPASFGQG